MKLSDIKMRDPFILPYDGKYYLFGSSDYLPEAKSNFYCHISNDLEKWSEPIKCFESTNDFWSDMDYWAPEVHYYKGKFYMFATFYISDKSRKRSVQILVSDIPEGPYAPLSEPLTPEDWMCLDGTLYVENDIPYMIFCHEWVQVHDGEMCLLRLTDDLTEPVGEPKLLFKASEPIWSCEKTVGGFVTDGPFFHKTKDGKLLMIWSSFDEKGYVEAVAISDDGTINGNWHHCKTLFSSSNAGHGMIFRSFNGKLFFTMHSPNGPIGEEHPHLYEIKEISTEPYLCFVEK